MKTNLAEFYDWIDVSGFRSLISVIILYLISVLILRVVGKIFGWM
jgi:hypothetical protein